MNVVNCLFVACALFVTTAGTSLPEHINNDINGTWVSESGGTTDLLLLQDGYLSLTSYNKTEKKFFQSKGGKYTATGEKLSLVCEFNSANKEEVGKTLSYTFSRNGAELVLKEGGRSQTFKLADSSSTPITGCWRINGRMDNGKMGEMKLAPRRTLKMLTGTRFQWMAINIESGEFRATGGGTYTFENGKYTEHIEFFSRDSTRVGASLSFDGKVEDNVWHHSGASSTGDPISETWVHYVK